MLTFLFWNLNGQPLARPIARLVARHQVDVLMLAECRRDIPPTLLQLLNGEPNLFLYHYASKPRNTQCSRIQIFTRFPDNFLPVIDEDDRTTIRLLHLPNRVNIVLAVTHLPSLLFRQDEHERTQILRQFAQFIKKAETFAGHTRTVVVGDLNATPFETGVVSLAGLNAVMTRRKASQQNRQKNDVAYPFFYNPMWGLLGDGSVGTPGSYYYRKDSQNDKAFFWYMLDQLLIRPSLLDRFDNRSLQLLEIDGQQSLVTKHGLPKLSDHLPLLFQLDI